jgi:hypothetical protein
VSCQLFCEAVTDVCPGDYECNNGLCAAPGTVCATIDSGIDAPTVCPPAFDSSVRLLTTANSYSTAGMTAVYSPNAPRALETTADSMIPGTIELTSELFNLSLPRLAPNKSDLFLLGENGGTFRLVRSSKDIEGAWLEPVPQAVNGVVESDGDLIPGTPTETVPRRMVVSFANTQLFEGVEGSSESWSFTPIPTNFGLFVVREANLSPDGMRMVFVGKPPVGPHAIYYAERTALDPNAWTTATVIYDAPGVADNEHMPTLSRDCQSLYYNSSEPGPAVFRVRPSG